MINWNQLNAALRRVLRAAPACGVLVMIAAVVLAVFDRNAQTALTGIALGFVVLELGFVAEGRTADAGPARPAAPAAPAAEPKPAPEKPAEALYCPHCGALRVEPGQKFCIECGKRLKR